MTHIFPTVEDAIEMHRELIDTFGGSHGLLDRGALQSALWRPQIGYYDGLLEEAAAMMESLSNNHPFIDGNKRVAFFVTDAFLRRNGLYINCDNESAYAFFMSLYESNSFRYGNLLSWLEQRTEPVRQD